MALLLALDISSSVDDHEDALQRRGLAAALLAPEVSQAALAFPDMPVAISVFEWSGRYQQQVILRWTMIDGPAVLRRIASDIAASRRSYAEFPTALGHALGYADGLFRDAPDCLHRTLDVSGDGINNDGYGPRLAYRYFQLENVTVNGLAILGGDDDVAGHYRDEMIRGPGAFVISADGFQDFERAMRRKLEREMAPPVIGAVR